MAADVDADGIADADGDQEEETPSWQFRTRSAAPPVGRGSRVLHCVADKKPFSAFRLTRAFTDARGQCSWLMHV